MPYEDEYTLSPGGQRVYKHKAREGNGIEEPKTCHAHLEDIDAFLRKTFGERKSFVHHEVISDRIHIDVIILMPSEEDQRMILFTSGMSDLSMNLPPDMLPEYRYLERAELVLYLPGDWQVNNDEKWFWPFRLIHMLARLPHEYNTWLGYGHSIPSGSDNAHFASNTRLCGSVLAGFEYGDGYFTASDGARINIYTVTPIYRQEMNYKLRNNADALLDKLSHAGITTTVNIKRKNVCSLFG